MKKIFTILLAMGGITSAFAQSGHSKTVITQTRTVSFNDHHDAMSARERDAQIAQINREYDNKVMAVKRDRFMKSNQKNRQVRLLEKQRQLEIKAVNDKFASQNKAWYGKGRNDRKW